LAEQQHKGSDGYQESKQNTDDERNNRMPLAVGLDPAFLCCSDAQPEEKFVHHPSLMADQLEDELVRTFSRIERSKD